MHDNNELTIWQLSKIILKQQAMICDLCGNDLMLIESSRAPVSAATIATAAEVVRTTLYSAHELMNRTQQLVEQLSDRKAA